MNSLLDAILRCTRSHHQKCSHNFFLTNDHLNNFKDWTDEKFDMKMTLFPEFHFNWNELFFVQSDEVLPMTTKIASNIEFRYHFKRTLWKDYFIFKNIIKDNGHLAAMGTLFFLASKRVKLFRYNEETISRLRNEFKWKEFKSNELFYSWID